MGTYQFKLPDIGEGIAEAEIVAWHVKVGDTIGEDQQIADMTTRARAFQPRSRTAARSSAVSSARSRYPTRSGQRC